MGHPKGEEKGDKDAKEGQPPEVVGEPLLEVDESVPIEEACRVKLENASRMADAMGKCVTFIPMTKESDGGDQLFIKACSNGESRVWPFDVFCRRYSSMVKQYSHFRACQAKGKPYREKSPIDAFSLQGDNLIGEATVRLKHLLEGRSVAYSSPVHDVEGNLQGRLEMSVLCVDENDKADMPEGSNGSDTASDVETDTLLGTELRFRVVVNEFKPALGPPGGYQDPFAGVHSQKIFEPSRYRHVWFRFKFDLKDPDECYCVSCLCEHAPFKFDFVRTFRKKLTPEFINILQSRHIPFEVWGIPLGQAFMVKKAMSPASVPSTPNTNPLLVGKPKEKPKKLRCVVCARSGRPGEMRKSGYKCKECIGIPSMKKQTSSSKPKPIPTSSLTSSAPSSTAPNKLPGQA